MLKRTPLYPFLIAIFPILSLASYNIHEIFVSAIFRPLIASLLLGVFVYGLAYLVTRELHRAALLARRVFWQGYRREEMPGQPCRWLAHSGRGKRW